MFTKTKSTPTETKANPFRDPLFRPKMSAFSSPDFRRKVESIIDRYAPKATEAVASSGDPHLPTDGHPGDILQLDSASDPKWLRKLTVQSSAPSDSEGDEGDIWIQT